KIRVRPPVSINVLTTGPTPSTRSPENPAAQPILNDSMPYLPHRSVESTMAKLIREIKINDCLIENLDEYLGSPAQSLSDPCGRAQFHPRGAARTPHPARIQRADPVSGEQLGRATVRSLHPPRRTHARGASFSTCGSPTAE